jgi:signal transduction histidine kinase
MTPDVHAAGLAVLVHELRSPVAALGAISEATAVPAHATDARSELVRLAIAAARSIDRLLTDAAVASIRAEVLNIGMLVREIVASHALRGADVVAEAEDDLSVLGDSVRLRQALDNLVLNAIAYGGPGRVTVRANRMEQMVRITVSDTGPGIAVGDASRIFEPGVRLATDVPGTGLGLPLARAIAVAHGGRLDLAPTAGGTTFMLMIPAHDVQPDTTASNS